MKKFYFVLFAMLIFSLAVSAQSVDLDRSYFKYAYRNLPEKPLALENRTYSVYFDATTKVKEIQDAEMIKANFNLVGLQKLDENGYLKFTIISDDLIVEKYDIETLTHESKDKSGKVTRTYTFRVTMAYKYNPYYTIVDAEGTTQASTKPSFFGSADTYASDEFKSSKEASQYLKLNKEIIIENIIRNKLNGVVSAAINQGNQLFGYKELSDNMLFWFLGSKKHPEFDAHQNILNEVKSLIASISADGGIEQAREVAKPIIEYLESVKGKYTEDNRKHRKMRYSSYYNLGMLYLALEQPDLAIEQANGLIENDYDTSDGKKIQDHADKMKKAFDVNGTSSRHFELVMPNV